MRGAGPSVGGGVGEVCGVAFSCGLVELETAACAKTDAAMANDEAATNKNLPIIYEYNIKTSPRKFFGATGFEPATSWSQTTRSTKLSYAPGNA